MAQKHCTGLPPREDNPDFNLRDWDLKASRIGRQTTNSRRFSASNITSLREDTFRSFRSNTTISSSASSPGYPLKEEINPSTYSFTTALKALQAKSLRRNWDCSSPEEFALNSKWNDAEKYICNPLSGQVPRECLSARSFRNLQSRITMSAPLDYSDKTRTAQIKPSLTARKSLFQIPIEEKKVVGMTRDVGIQSTEAEINESSSSISLSSSSSSPSPASTPSIGERMSKRLGTEAGESSYSSSKPKSEGEVEVTKKGGPGGGDQVDHQVEEEEGKEESSKGGNSIGESDQKGSWCDDACGDDHEEEEEEQQQQIQGGSRRSADGGGCLSWMRSRRLHQHQQNQTQKVIIRPHKIKKHFFISCTKVRRR